MIVARCRAIDGRLQAYRRAVAEADADRALEPAVAELEWARAALDAEAGRAALLRGRELLRKKDLPRTTTVAKNVAEVRGQLAEPAAIPDGKAFKNLLKNLERLTEALREKTLAAWRAWLEVETPTVHEDRLARVEGLPGEQEFARRMREVCERVTRLEDEAPSSAEQFTAAQQVLAEWRELLARVPVLLDEAEVRAFRAAVEAGGAPLSLLTDAVVRWLRENAPEGMRVVQTAPGSPGVALEPSEATPGEPGAISE